MIFGLDHRTTEWKNTLGCRFQTELAGFCLIQAGAWEHTMLSEWRQPREPQQCSRLVTTLTSIALPSCFLPTCSQLVARTSSDIVWTYADRARGMERKGKRWYSLWRGGGYATSPSLNAECQDGVCKQSSHVLALTRRELWIPALVGSPLR